MARLVFCTLASTAAAGYGLLGAGARGSGLLGAGAVAPATGAVGAAAEDAASVAYVAGDFLLIESKRGELEFATVVGSSGPGTSVHVKIVDGDWIRPESVDKVIITRGPRAPGSQVRLRHPSKSLVVGKVVKVVSELGGFITAGQLGPTTFPVGSVLVSYTFGKAFTCVIDPRRIVQVLAHGLKQEEASKRVQQLTWHDGKWHKAKVHKAAYKVFGEDIHDEASKRIAKPTWDEARKPNFQRLSTQQLVDRSRAAQEQASKLKFRQFSAQQLIDAFKKNSEIVKAPNQESTHADGANPPLDEKVINLFDQGIANSNRNGESTDTVDYRYKDYYYGQLQEQALADYEEQFA